MGSLPIRFWVTMGYGLHPEHSINAYDEALRRAGICDQNIIQVSSVPPPEQISPVVRHNITYVPMPTEEQLKLFPNITRKKIHRVAIIDKKQYLVLDESMCINVVMARSEGAQFQRITSSIGLVWYASYKAPGVFAVEDHGNNTIEGSRDNCCEMMRRMLKARGKTPIKIDEPKREIPFGKNTELVKMRLWECGKPMKMKIYTMSIDGIPEGLNGCAISTVVFDPFTEIHS